MGMIGRKPSTPGLTDQHIVDMLQSLRSGGDPGSGGGASLVTDPEPAQMAGTSSAPRGMFGRGAGGFIPQRDAPAEQATLHPTALVDTQMPLSATGNSQLMQDVPQLKKSGPNFGKILGDAALYAGASFGVLPAIMALGDRRKARNDASALDKYAQQQAILDRYKASDAARNFQFDRAKPQYQTVGKTWQQYDPLTKQTSQLYKGASDEVQLAQDLNLKPGTPEYYAAIKDKGLGAYGPTNMGLQNRQLNDTSARGWAGVGETRRHNGVTESLGRQNAGEVTPSKVVGPILAKIAGGAPLAPGERAALDRYKAMDPLNQMMGAMLGGGVAANNLQPQPVPQQFSRGIAAPVASLPPRPIRPTRAVRSNRASGPVSVDSVEQAKALPPGTVFVTPDGRRKVR